MNNYQRIARILEAQGHTANGIGRRVRATACPTCRQPTLTGLDADTAAFTATADPAPLDPLGEALAVLAGRTTYELHHAGSRLELERRDSFAMRTPAGAKTDVLAEHRCGAPPLPALPSRLARIAPKETPTCLLF